MPRDEYAFTSFFYNWLVEPHLKTVKYYVTEICVNIGAERVVDICCGTGTQCNLLAESGILCFGVDISPGMLKVATKKRHNNSWFTRMDSTLLGFKNNAFDAAIISFALHEKSYNTRHLIAREAKKIVKNDGTILIADYIVSRKSGKPDWKTNVVEFLAGKEHYRCFTDFCARGGLLGLLELFNLPGKLVKTFRNDSWGILILENA